MKHNKADYSLMVTEALSHDGAVLIAWQHQDIYWGECAHEGIARCIFGQTKTPQNALVPTPWPSLRYDLVWVFDIDPTTGQVCNFTQVPQMLLPGDLDTVIS